MCAGHGMSPVGDKPSKVSNDIYSDDQRADGDASGVAEPGTIKSELSYSLMKFISVFAY